MKKIYSAFISSTSKESKYRKNAFDILESLGFYCYGMENFKVHEFSTIKDFIKNSDFVLLIMGTDYGSICQETKKSFTQSEIEYAQTLGKPVLVVLTPDFSSALDEPCSLEEAQLDFYQSLINNKMLPIRIQRKEKNNLNKILTEYTSNNMVSFPGWSRNDITGKELEQWAQEHSNYNLNGIWYHFHYSDEDRNYLRAGTISIVQDFTPSGYKKYKFYGQNVGFKEDNNKKIILSENGSPVIDNEKYSNWDGEYALQANHLTLSGIYHVDRGYSKSNFASQSENIPRTKGIHDFYLSSSSGLEKPSFFHGMFYDITSLKHGKISVFKSKEERDKKIIEYLNNHNLISK